MSRDTEIETLQTLPLESIVTSPFQIRFAGDDVDLEDLAESIRTYGVLEPIRVRPLEADKYELVMGDRRVKAAKKAGLNCVPAIVKKLSDEEAVILQGTENLHRKDLLEIEKTNYLAELAKVTGWTAKEISEKLKRSYTWVVKYLPEQFKNKKMAELGKAGGESKADATRRVAELEQAEKELFEKPTAHCSDPSCLCPLLENEIKIVDGRAYCFKHFVQAKIDFDNEQKRLEGEKEAAKKPVTPKSLDTAEERKARMHPHDSQFQIEVFTELAAEGLTFEQNQKLPVLETEPDGLREDVGLLVYLDSTFVHKGKQLDKDERLRELYKKHHPDITILGIAYSGKSDKEKARVKGLIREKYEFLRSERQKWKTDISQPEEEES